MTWTGTASNIVLTVGDKAEYGSDGSSKAGQFDFVSVTVTLEGGEEDTRTATTIEFGDHATEGNVGDELPFPTVIVNDPTGAPVSDAFVVWESNDSDVATIGDGVIILQKAGTAKITATFEGDNNYKPSSKSFTVIVTDPNQPGISQDNPYTVAQARAAIDAGTGVTGVYAMGYAVPLGYTYIKWKYTEKVTGNVGLGNIQVVESGTEEKTIITAARWATYVTKHPVQFTYGGAYVVTEATTTKVTLQEVESAPAGTPVLLSSSIDEEYEFSARYSTDADVTAPEVNLLKASNGNVKGGATIYALANQQSGVGFYNVEEGVIIPAGKAYLEIAAETAEAGARPFLAIGGEEATGINAVEQAVKQGVQVFDLQGRRVSQPTKGLYIVNGQKVVVK